MAYLNDKDREARIKELEGFRDGWRAMIEENQEKLDGLARLKIAGIDAFDNAIIDATEASKKLAAAKANIEAAIQRVREGGGNAHDRPERALGSGTINRDARPYLPEVISTPMRSARSRSSS